MEPLETYYETKNLEEYMFEIATSNNWGNIIRKYDEDPRAQKAIVDGKMRNTCLHLAVNNNQAEVVSRLLQCIQKFKNERVLEIRNKKQETPLHIAASLGNDRMCYEIAHVNPHLVHIRNADGETPLFLAASHGHNNAFFCLLSFSASHSEQFRRANGDSVLHCAIINEHFDLAYKIINIDKEMVNWKNEQGLTPLHLLASKPAAFKSGCHIGGWKKLVYNYLEDRPDFDEQEQIVDDQRITKLFNICMNFVKVFCDVIILIPVLGFGSKQIRKIQEIKKKHIWSFQVLNLLLKTTSLYQYDEERSGSKPSERQTSLSEEILNEKEDDVLLLFNTNWKKRNERKEEKLWAEAPILMAAKNGVLEIVEETLKQFPSAIYEMNNEEKNIVHLAVEYRQPEVYNLLLKHDYLPKLSVLHKLDIHGNGVLHLAAQFTSFEPITVPGLQMIWEIKWFEFIKSSVPPDYLLYHNKKDETPMDIFTKSHEKLIFEGQGWLSYVSGSCSVVSGIIAAAAFSISANIPDKEKPSPHNETVSIILSISSLLALCYSVTSMITFLAIQLSRYQQKDFYDDLPWKLLVGLLSLYASIAAMMTYASAAYFFVLKDKLKYVALLVSAVSWLPFILGHLQLVVDLFQLYVSNEPNRLYYQLRI